MTYVLVTSLSLFFIFYKYIARCYLIASPYCLAMLLQLLVLSTIICLVPALPSQGRIGPEPSFQRRWKTKLQNFRLSYGSVSMAMHDDTLFVLNGGDVGNYVEKFSSTGNYSGEYAGWYNWPIDLVVGVMDRFWCLH